MTDQRTNEFNSIAMPSEEVKRKLLYLATIGSESVLSAHRVTGELNGAKAREDDRFFDQLVQLALGSPERIALFHTELDQFEERRIALLLRTEEELREVREKVTQLRDDALEMTMEDGTRRRIFRDHDQVRDETGVLVSTEMVKPESVSENPRQWADLVSGNEIRRQLEARRDRLFEAGQDIEDARQRSTDRKMTDEDMDTFKSDFEKLLAEEEREIELTPDADPVGRDQAPGTRLRPPDPDASGPAPG